MARCARPWFRKDRGMFHVQINGKQYPLHVTDPTDASGADDAYRKLLDRLAAHPTQTQRQPDANPTTVSEAVAAFLARADSRVARGKIEARSVRNYRIFLKHLEKEFGGKPLHSLTADDLEIWAAKPHWSNSYQHDALGCVGSLLKANKIVLDPPIQRPPTESRGAETCLTDDQFQLVLDHLYLKGGKSRGDLVELVCLLRECGRRPSEVSSLTVDRIDWILGCTILKKHKTKKKTGKNQTLFFNSAAMRILEGQRAKYGTGLLFRTRGGRKAYGPNVIVKQLLKVSERVGFRVIAYGLGRHSFATRALIAGISDVVVAALIGTGVGMIERHYGHVGDEAKVLKDAAEKASTKRPA